MVAWIGWNRDLLLLKKKEKKKPWVSTLSPMPRAIVATRWIIFTQISQAIVAILRRTLVCRGSHSMINHSISIYFSNRWHISVWGWDQFCMNNWFKIDGDRVISVVRLLCGAVSLKLRNLNYLRQTARLSSWYKWLQPVKIMNGLLGGT